jgi:hypothetical protein
MRSRSSTARGNDSYRLAGLVVVQKSESIALIQIISACSDVDRCVHDDWSFQSLLEPRFAAAHSLASQKHLTRNYSIAEF